MEKETALKIIGCLREGLNPYTGVELPMDSVFQRVETVRALTKAIDIFKPIVEKERIKKSRPANLGKRWTHEEGIRLTEEFNDGKTIKNIALIHARNRGGIEARLIKLGLIEGKI
jgi:hypothetical protein